MAVALGYWRIWRITPVLVPPTKEEANVFPVFVCLSVCLSVSKTTQNACMDLDEMLRVDRRRDMDELINL